VAVAWIFDVAGINKPHELRSGSRLGYGGISPRNLVKFSGSTESSQSPNDMAKAEAIARRIIDTSG